MVQESKDHDAEAEQAAEGEPKEEPVSEDMATMPIPDLVAGIRAKANDMQPLQALVMGVLAGRLTQEYERANQCEKDAALLAQKLSAACTLESIRVQFLVDHWPGELLDGGITFPDGELVFQTGRGP